MRHLMNALDLTVDEIHDLIVLAEKIIQDPARFSEVCKGGLRRLRGPRQCPFDRHARLGGSQAAGLGRLGPYPRLHQRRTLVQPADDSHGDR